MNPFLCVVDLEGGSVGIEALAAALPAFGQSEDRAEVLFHGSWAGAWVPSAELERPAIAHRHGVIALGNVRITNRRAFPGVGRSGAGALDDLELVIDHYLLRGDAGLGDLVGDFAFVLWDTRQARLVAVRDALGVKSLFYQRRWNRLAVASHLDCFEPAGYDREFLAEYLIGMPRSTERTVFSDVSRILPGGYLTAGSGRVTLGRHWNAADFVAADDVADEKAAVLEFRTLFEEAVRVQFDDDRSTWSQLSGGLDSSSIVAMAETLAARGQIRGLGGTETVVDSLSEGDETRYSNAVATRYRLRNTKIADYWAWQADQHGPHLHADPRPFLPFFARNRAMRDAVHSEGGRVLLSGFGSDNYLAGSFDYIADLVRDRRYGTAFRLLTDVAVTTRRSFWTVSGRHVLAPLGPRWLRRRLVDAAATPPGWLDPALVSEFGLEERMANPSGHLAAGYAAFQAAEIGSIDLALERGPFEEGIEMRYPFLHRPLVEFTLRLPYRLRFRPYRPKWILREAMGNLLPDSVRNRAGKGGIDGRIAWSLERERPLLDRLIGDSHLADLGCVSPESLKQAFSEARAGAARSVGLLFVTLSLETWFAVRSGWWRHHAAAVPAPSTHFILPEEQHHVEARVH